MKESNQPPTDGLNNISANDDGISIKEIILIGLSWCKYLLSRWLIILAFAITGSSIGFLNAYFKKVQYVADMTFVLEESPGAGGLGAYSGLATMVGIDLGGGSGGGVFSGDNLLELLKSRSMIERVLLTPVNAGAERKTLAEFYIDIYELRKGWKNDSRLSKIRFSPNEDRSMFPREKDSVLAKIYKNIVTTSLSVTKKDKKLSIIVISMKSTNELFSKYFTERLKDVVSTFYIETRTKKSAENLAILQHQVDSVRRALSLAVNGAALAIDVNPNPNPSRQILRASSQNKQIDVQGNVAILQSLLPNLEMARITLRKETPLIQVIDRPILPLSIEKASKLKGLVIGGLVGGFCAIFLLIARKVFMGILK